MTEPHPASTSSAPREEAGRLRGVRRSAVIAAIVSVSVAAIVGILALLGGTFGAAQIQIIFTTLLVTGFSVTVLCHLAVAGRPVRLVGFVGIGVSVVALVLGFLLIWAVWGTGTSEVFRLLGWFTASAILAVSLAHANLLLLLAGRRRPVVRIALGATLAAIAGVAVLGILPIITDSAIPGVHVDGYWRWFGVIAILDALGTIALPILALITRDRPVDRADAAPDGADTAAEHAPAASALSMTAVSTSPALEARIVALGTANRLDRDELLAAALDAFEAVRPDAEPT